MRALGIDFGETRIGIAVSDPDGRWALPLTSLERRTDRRAVYAITEIARREGVGVLVLGEPLGPGGETGRAALRVRRFGARLARAARLPVVWIDETLTTVEADARLRTAGLDARRDDARRDDARRDDARRDDARRDAVAAQILLQEALDRGLAADVGDGG